jgi:hypothetical protein
MATSKLTLSVDTDTIQIAKRVASESNMSVSKLFKKLVTEIDKKKIRKDPLLEKFKNLEISPDIEALKGVLKSKYPGDMDYKNLKYEYLKEKYDL